ncbi:low-specificity L-threonine aldolase [Idiomarina sp. M1R2S28]|uniref:Low-specificity L-threonine aldolase n=1 Tax=Idiomarina rhizosphaerae TaxID=2961572 RepID=A0A9X2FVF2_9GAMM|nr:low-specificity L-threonine aldolase [Idiomarina rhizosphaerae]MCP1338124.1 low-specificity L-threonine aldolase [Idiomarina rhizosphaerae]
MLDLRSDTVTLPSAAMRTAIAEATVGDDVYGEDPSINALEKRVAELLGKEDALLCSSGTQSNLLGLMSHCRNGEEYIVGQEYHTYRYEAGGAAVLGSIVPQTIEVEADGTLSLATIEKRIKPNDPHFPITRLLAFENTHGGQLIDQDYFDKARILADQNGLSMHLDGARLPNAAIASGRSMAELAAPFDSVSLCCSKGLGAPIGSLLAGSKELIARARRWRKMVGGGMRQAGFVAVAIDYALTNQFERIQQDHDNAEWLFQQLSELLAGTEAKVRYSGTNMTFVELPDSLPADSLRELMAEHDIKLPGGQKLRLVCHLDVSREHLERFVELFKQWLSSER